MHVDQILRQHGDDFKRWLHAFRGHATVASMEHSLAWAIIGLVLVITELLSGTFYLLMLGIAAFGGAGAAFIGLEFSLQGIVAVVGAGIGCYGVAADPGRKPGQRKGAVGSGRPGG